MLIESTLVFDGVSGFFLDYSMIIINRGSLVEQVHPVTGVIHPNPLSSVDQR